MSVKYDEELAVLDRVVQIGGTVWSQAEIEPGDIGPALRYRDTRAMALTPIRMKAYVKTAMSPPMMRTLPGTIWNPVRAWSMYVWMGS